MKFGRIAQTIPHRNKSTIILKQIPHALGYDKDGRTPYTEDTPHAYPNAVAANNVH